MTQPVNVQSQPTLLSIADLVNPLNLFSGLASTPVAGDNFSIAPVQVQHQQELVQGVGVEI